MSTSAAFGLIPTEVLQLIANHLDSPSAYSFSLLSRQCASVAGPSLWRELVLTTRSKNEEVLREKMRELTRRGAIEKWKLVQSIKAVAAHTAAFYLLQVLESTSGNLTSLDIAQGKSLSSNPLNDLDLRFLYCGPSLYFPALTHLRLDDVLRMVGSILYLCDRAPNLVSLDVSLDMQGYVGDSVDSTLHFVEPWRLARDTKLERIRLSYNGPICVARRQTFVDYGQPNNDDDTSTDVCQPLGSLIEGSPKLRQLSIRYMIHDRELEENWDDFVEAICRHPKLTDLHWQEGSEMLVPSPVCASEMGAVDPLRAVRRLITDLCWSKLITEFPSYPKLQYLIFDCADITSPPCPVDIPVNSLPPHQIRSQFADWLRANPQLCLVYWARNLGNTDDLAVFDNFDRLNKAGDAVGSIQSVRHGPHEVLHVRLPLTHVAVPASDSSSDASDGGGIGEEDEEGTGWRRDILVYIDRVADGFPAKPVLQDFVHWDGLAVPLEILERALEVEGIGEEWYGRGYEVGEEAWRVLTDWRNGISPCEFNRSMDVCGGEK